MKRRIRKFIRDLKRIPPAIHLLGCIVALGYTGYLLFSGTTDAKIGTIILIAELGILAWNISVLFKDRLGLGDAIVMFLVASVVTSAFVGAFNGVSPFCEWKCDIEDYVRNNVITPVQEHFSDDEVTSRIVAEDIVEQVGGLEPKYLVPVELEPTDLVIVEKEYGIELLDYEGYSFGTVALNWTATDARQIKSVTFEIPKEDKVAAKISELEEECRVGAFVGDGWDTNVQAFEKGINKLLKIEIHDTE